MLSLFLFLGYSMFFARNSCHAQMTSERHAAFALLEHYETVLYARADFLSNSDEFGGMDKDSADTLRLPFQEILEGLKHSGTYNSMELMRNSDAVLLGAREFRPPAGLGAVHSKRCYIVILRGNNKQDIHKYFRRAATESLDGLQVWKWSAQLGEFGEDDASQPSTFYAVQIKRSYLLIANNRDDLRDVMRGLTSTENHEAILADIPDWDILSVHEVWGYRHIRRTGIFNEEVAGLSFVTPSIEVLSFFVDFKKKSSVVRILGSDMNRDTVPKINPAAEPPTFKWLAPGIWEAKIPFSENQAKYSPLLLILVRLGFGIHV
jgi:hypothetical protein